MCAVLRYWDPGLAAWVNVAATGPPGPSSTKYTTTFGNGSAQAFTITHNLGTQAVFAQVFRTAAPYDEVDVEIERTSTMTITIRTPLAVPTTNQFTVVVVA